MKRINREAIQRMVDASGGKAGGTSGGGGGSLAGYATQAWVNEGFVSVEFFNRLFTVYGPGETSSDPDVVIEPNDLDSTINNIKAMFGLWTEQYLSALGLNPGGTGSATSLSMLDDVYITSPTNGQALVYNATSTKWENQTISTVTALANLTDVLLTSPAANQVLVYDGTQWINSSVKTVNGYSILGTGDIPASGGGTGNYLPLKGGTLYNSGSRELLQLQSNDGPYVVFRSNTGWLGAIGTNTSMGVCFYDLYNDGYRVSSSFRVYENDLKFYKSSTDTEYSLLTTYNGLCDPLDFSSGVFNENRTYYAYNTSSESGFGVRRKTNSTLLIMGRYDSYGYIATLVSGSVTYFEFWPSGDFKASGRGSFNDIRTLNPSSQTTVLTVARFLQYDANPFGLLIKTNGSTGAVTIQSQRESNDSECYPLLLNPQGGNVGIGTSSPSYALHVSGSIYATGGITALSDIKQKNVEQYDAYLGFDEVANAPIIKFTWKDPKAEDKGLHVGSIAQYWEKVLPEAVKRDKEGTLSMSYGVVALVAAISTAKKVRELDERVTKLEKIER